MTNSPPLPAGCVIYMITREATMANELTLRVNVGYEKLDTILSFLHGPKDYDVTGTKPLRNRQLVGITEEALVLGDASVGGYFVAVNRDPTNFVKIRAGSGLADLVKLLPGDVCLFRIASGATPYAISDTAACELDYLVLPA